MVYVQDLGYMKRQCGSVLSQYTHTHTQSSQNIPFILSQMLSILGKDIMLNRYISNCWAVNQTAVQAQAQAQFPQTKFEHRDN